MPLLKGNKLKERLSWFENWKSQIEVNLGFVRSVIPGLDYTSESLNQLESYLLEKFDSPMDAYSIKNKELLDSVCLYIGEVYRRNISLNIEWDVNIDTSDENKGMYNFLCYLKSYKEFIGFNPFSKIPFALNKKTGDKLYSHLIHNVKLFKEKVEFGNEFSEIPEHKGCQYNHFLYVEEGSINLVDINKRLVYYYKDQSRKLDFRLFGETHFVLTLDEKYNFHFSVESGVDIQEEAKEIGLNPELISKRIEFWGDADPDGIYLNEHMFILEQFDSYKLSVYNISGGYLI